MATRVLPFTVTVPAGTLETNPYAQAIDLDGWILERLDLEVPPGPQGLMGFQIYNGGVPWLPYGPGEWVIWDNARDSWYLTDQPNGQGWEVVAYNTGTYDHTVKLRCHVSSAVAQQQPPAPAPLTFITTPAQQPAVVLA